MPHEIVPDDVDAAELRRRKGASGANKHEPVERCPDCGYAKLAVRVARYEDPGGAHYCRNCQTTVSPVVADSIAAAKEADPE